MIALLLSNIAAKYYKNLSMVSRVIAINVGDVFTALHGMQPRYGEEISVCLSVFLSVCLSVCPSHAWIVTKR